VKRGKRGRKDTIPPPREKQEADDIMFLIKDVLVI
jgi:hypothetical protein